MRIFKSVKLTIILVFVLVSIASAATIRVLYLATADGTAPTNPSAPTTVTLLATITGVTNIAEYGSFFGRFGSTSPYVRYSTNGIAWSDSPTAPSLTAVSSATAGSRWLSLGNPSGATPCEVEYSDNSGTTWSSVVLTLMEQCETSNITNQALQCVGATCLAVGYGPASSSAQFKVYRSTNSGSSWSEQYTTTAINAQISWTIAWYDGTVAIIGGRTAGTGTLRIFTSVDNGVSWTMYNTGISATLLSCEAGTIFGADLYLACKPQTSNDLNIWRSTDNGGSWTNLGHPTMSPDPGTVFSANPLLFACYSNYSNPTCYLSVQPTTDNLVRIYTTEDMTTWTLLYTHPTNTIGRGKYPIQDSNSDIYFGTTNASVLKIS